MNLFSRKTLIVVLALLAITTLFVIPAMAGGGSTVLDDSGVSNNHHKSYTVTLEKSKTYTLEASCSDASSTGLAFDFLSVAGGSYGCATPVSTLFTVPADGSYSVDFHVHTNQANCDPDCDFNYSIKIAGYAPGVKPAIVLIEPQWAPSDARINRNNINRGESAAVYCESNSIHVWAIDDQSVGHEVITASAAEINAVGVPGEVQHDFVIKSAAVQFGTVTLYRLWTGEFQVNAPGVRANADSYTYIWNQCNNLDLSQ